MLRAIIRFARNVINRGCAFPRTARRCIEMAKARCVVSAACVYFRRENLAQLPELPDIEPFRIANMDLNSESHTQAWLRLVNRAFFRQWSTEDFISSISYHPNYRVLETYFLVLGSELVGTCSIGVFRMNPTVGVTHYLALQNEFRGQGLGKYLLLYGLHRLRKYDVCACEGESTLAHKESLFIHFGLGFRPKRSQPWNTQTLTVWLSRRVAWRRFVRLYEMSRESGQK